MPGLPWTPAQIIRAVRNYSGMVETVAQQQATIEKQSNIIARMKIRLSRAEKDTQHQAQVRDELQNYARSLEQKYILASPEKTGPWLAEGDAAKLLPLPLTTRDNSRVYLLWLSDWERFAAWAVPRVRARPYQADRWDCGSMTAMLLGLAHEWMPSLACGWVELASPRGTPHKMMWLLSQVTDGIMGLSYIDAVPRPLVPWSEGIFTEAEDVGGIPWHLDRLGF